MSGLLLVIVQVAILWVLVTGRPSPGGLAVGLVVGAAAALALRRLHVPMARRVTADQVLAALRYATGLVGSALGSSFRVARLVLRRRIDLHTGIVALPPPQGGASTQLTALTVHGITMGPGQLVVDFGDDGTLYVHLLDYARSRPRLAAEQEERTRLLRRVLAEEQP